MNIYPSILFDSGEEAREWVEKAAETGKYSRMQVDFVDGEYANRPAIEVAGYEYIKNYSNIKFDAHLMVTEKNIERHVTDCQKFGFDRIIVQMESVASPEKYNALSLDIHSPVRAIEPFFSKINYVNIMSIEPGFGGQEYLDLVNEKIDFLNNWRRIKDFRFLICVDGGVEKELLPELEKLGVDEVVVGVKRLLQW